MEVHIMEYVSEYKFVELLNEELVKRPDGSHLPPFVLGPQGYNWPRSEMKVNLVYYHVANFIREKYGIYH